ncbi:hypothetical protein FV222_00190 [Methylobacterium sp. WL103]|uniref:hypothetical protein n=1 Tax=Methylobacterium sp. WL103 TaxID=2603891 RepID=UPI0011CA75CA|nr:hypothetical protein [Methylobacterium sp. WL103]TXN08925.1 hypothetical protein FV222_00190 [Methylobacterium sp. WL103]
MRPNPSERIFSKSAASNTARSTTQREFQMARTASTRARKSFTSAVKIGVSIGESDFNQHMLDANAFHIESVRADRETALTEAFAAMPETDVLLDEVVQEIEAEEMRDEVHAAEATEEPAATTEISFRDLMLMLDENDVDLAQRTINAAIDERAAFENAKHGDGANIQKTLKKARESMGLSRGPARVLIAAAVDTAFVNRSQHDGSRYNVYAIGKVVDLLRALASDAGEVQNAINRCVTMSLFNMAKAGQTFSLETAKSAASDKYQSDLAIRKHLVRHTVSASTAPTQASSTMQALETLGVVTRSGSSRNPTFALTTNPIVKAIEGKLFKGQAQAA